LPGGKSEAIWKHFKEATRNFNRAKNSFYKNIKNEQVENLKKKLNLVEQAESLKDSEDWDTVTEIFKKIQSDWKKIGHVPKKDSDKIWKRFKDACNHYFDRLHERQDDVDKELIDVLNKKKEMLNDLKEKVKEEVEVTLEEVNEHITEWRSAGRLPSKMSHIEAKFNKTLEAIYKKLNID
jgi:vacuolar-type H+-ATPase subunit I/STV1